MRISSCLSSFCTSKQTSPLRTWLIVRMQAGSESITTPLGKGSGMGLMEDMLKVFDRWDVWQEMKTLPQRVSDLEAKVADLNAKLGGKWPPDVCRSCGERAMRLSWVGGPDDRGNMREDWECKACKFIEIRKVKPQ